MALLRKEFNRVYGHKDHLLQQFIYSIFSRLARNLFLFTMPPRRNKNRLLRFRLYNENRSKARRLEGQDEAETASDTASVLGTGSGLDMESELDAESESVAVSEPDATSEPDTGSDVEIESDIEEGPLDLPNLPEIDDALFNADDADG